MSARVNHALSAEMRELVENWNSLVLTPRSRSESDFESDFKHVPWWRRKITTMCQFWKRPKKNPDNQFDMSRRL